LPTINVALHFQTGLGKAEARWRSDRSTATKDKIGHVITQKELCYTLLHYQPRHYQNYTLSNGPEDPKIIILTFKIRLI
jgi:hypothetical protein